MWSLDAMPVEALSRIRLRKDVSLSTTSTRTRILVGAATFLSGILAGGVIDRVIVGGPAWHELGAQAWVQYSVHADLGPGLLAYPFEAIGSALLIAAAVISTILDGAGWQRAARPLYVAAFFSVTGLLLTVKAAPIMLSLAQPQPARSFQQAFDDFFLWGLYLRGTADMLAFISLICGLVWTVRTDDPPSCRRTTNHKG